MEARSERRWWHGVVIGLVTAAVALGVAQLVAGILEPSSSPILTIGQAAIDASPEWLKAWAIRSFGTRDKIVLLGGMTVVLVATAAGLGVVAIRRPAIATAGLVALGLLGVAAAVTRPAAGPLAALPAVCGTVAGAMALRALRAASPAGEADAGGVDRRRFLWTVAGGLGVAVVAGGAGAALARRFRADDSRAAVALPDPASRAPTTAGTDPGVPGAEPYLTTNDRFYRVDTALLVPSVTAEEWRLRIHGMVGRERTITYEELLARPLIERDVTLTCVSNEVGGDYAGNARWIGAPLADLLAEVDVDPAADQVVSTSADGWTSGTPTAELLDGRDAMLAVAMNGEPLPLAHGFPVRMIVPGLYGYVSATKWVTDLELTTFRAYDPYWVTRGWAARAPIETMARIDTPRARSSLAPGAVAIAGVAWAQHTGIGAVELRIDDEPWRAAELAAVPSDDTWRLWVFRWQAEPGTHRIAARAIDRDGVTQTESPSPPFPDGATGYHAIEVEAG